MIIKEDRFTLKNTQYLIGQVSVYYKVFNYFMTLKDIMPLHYLHWK